MSLPATFSENESNSKNIQVKGFRSMIHIATVHFRSDQWIDVQKRYLERHLKSPFRVYAWLNEVPPVPPGTFHYSCSEPITAHSVKLNLLADLIYFDSNRDDDILIFLDGDAFPVADIEPLIREKLATHKLIAVQRLENDGDIQPHPCFCVTTVRFWRSIKADWSEGHQWINKSGVVTTDVGGNLLKLLGDTGTDWYPLRRSSGISDHPVLFGIYGGLVYHHGAGFRNPVTRGDMAELKIGWGDRIRAVFPARVERVAQRRLRRKLEAMIGPVSEQVFRQIQASPQFFKDHLAPERSSPVLTACRPPLLQT
jgi:hypothetical protein